MLVLGISAWYHDAAAVLLEDGEIAAALQEERLSRVKHDPSFPVRAVAAVLARAGARLDDLAAVVLYDKPLLKLERILETFSAHAPRGILAFARAMPAWLGDKLLARSTVRRELGALALGRVPPILFSEHHLSHAASAFYPSPFEEAAVLTIDGVGEWATASIGHGRGAELAVLRELHFPHSLGLFYSAVTQFLGFRVNSDEYKLMGLAPYGDERSARTAAFRRAIREHLLHVGDDGALRLGMRHFAFPLGGEMIRAGSWERILGVAPRRAEDPLSPIHADLALAAQRETEDAVLAMAREARRLTGARHACLAGGVALNCVANGRLLEAGVFDEIWVQPAAGDAGGALGAAYAAHHLRFGAPRAADGRGDRMQGALLGLEASDAEVLGLARRVGARFEEPSSLPELCARTARLLADGKVVGWYQGRDEWGPRALGNRSIVADPRRPEMQHRLNLAIKGREGFRPFAPAVLAERASAWFELSRPSPYMLFTAPVAAGRRRPVAPSAERGALAERLAAPRSEIPAVTHVDLSARVQTVDRAVHPRFAALLDAFEAATGCPVLLNTSFNVRDEPIVASVEDAWRCFVRAGLDALVLGDRLFERARQPSLGEGAP